MSEQTLEEMAMEVMGEANAFTIPWWLEIKNGSCRIIGWNTQIGGFDRTPEGIRQAVEHVKQQADAGSELHRKALVVHIASLLE